MKATDFLKMIDLGRLDSLVNLMEIEGDWIVYFTERYNGDIFISVTNKLTFIMCLNSLENCDSKEKDKVIGHKSFDSKDEADKFKDEVDKFREGLLDD